MVHFYKHGGTFLSPFITITAAFFSPSCKDSYFFDTELSGPSALHHHHGPPRLRGAQEHRVLWREVLLTGKVREVFWFVFLIQIHHHL